MSSAPSGSSSSPEPQIVQPKKKSGKHKQKQGVITPHGGDEATNDHTPAYEPPKGSVLFDHDVDFGEFDWDSVKNDEDVELWLIRVPDTIRPKYIEKLKMDNHSSSSRSVRVGQFERKHTKYDVWSLGDERGDDEHIGGEEMKTLSCFLPRKRKDGKLYLAPKPISRHIVLSASPALPTPDPSHSGGSLTLNQNPPRHSYSKELFKHRFMPYGSLMASTPTGGGGEAPSSVDVEMVNAGSSSQVGSTEKSKKRSRESDPFQRSKKVKGPNILKT